MVSAEALAGYLLEEVLAHLLRSNGYRLLTSRDDDEDALSEGGHGLLVRGRGADHQADALGDLLLPSPFSLPVRLFVEGKNRKEKVTLAEVRNAHGVISDVNEHYSSGTAASWRQPLRRYQYRYALFSSAGFKADAQSYAMAQQISLVDLSGAAFQPMVEAVRRSAARALALAAPAGLTTFPVKQVRLALRAALAGVDAPSERGRGGAGPGPASEAERTARHLGGLAPKQLAGWAARTVTELNSSPSGEDLLLGFPPAPFILAMRPDNMDDFESYVERHGPEIRVRIGFGGVEGVRGDWYITPEADRAGFRLRFGLPGALEAWLLSAPEETLRRASEAKRALLSTISVFLDDRLVRLVFQPVPARSGSGDQSVGMELPDVWRLGVSSAATDATEGSWLRRQLTTPPEPLEAPRDTRVAPDPGDRVRREHSARWTPEAVAELLRRLRTGDYVQAELLVNAAAEEGVLGRDAVYRIAGYPPGRSLRGLTRPFRRITAELIDGGWLPEKAAYPFQTQYARGVRATHFVVPNDVLAALDEAERQGLV